MAIPQTMEDRDGLIWFNDTSLYPGGKQKLTSLLILFTMV